MAKYNIHFIHKISPRPIPQDSIGPVEIPGSAFAGPNEMAKALRKLKVLGSGEGLKSARAHLPSSTLCFPKSGPWHCLVIDSAGPGGAGSYTPAGIFEPGYHHLNQAGKPKTSTRLEEFTVRCLASHNERDFHLVGERRVKAKTAAEAIAKMRATVGPIANGPGYYWKARDRFGNEVG